MSRQLSKLMSRENLTQEDVASILGVSQAAVSLYIRDKNDIPLRRQKILIEKFNLPNDYFISDRYALDENQLEAYAESDVIWLPVFDAVPCGRFEAIKGEVVFQMPTPRAMLNGLIDPEANAFWINAIGNSMYPKIRHGDQILIARNCTIDNGNLVVACIDDMVTLKRFFDKGDRITLVPENNTDFKTIEILKSDLFNVNVILYKVLRISSKP